MRNGQSVLLLFVLWLVWSAGCTQKNNSFCDAQTPCTSAATPFCDAYGEYQPNIQTCIAPPQENCQTHQDCVSITRPLCHPEWNVCSVCWQAEERCGEKSGLTPACSDSGQCLTCLSSQDCSFAEPICDTFTQRCFACVTNEECATRDPLAPTCDSQGQCIACDDTNVTCTMGDASFCRLSDFRCVTCTDHSHCDSKICDLATNTCVPEDQIWYVDSLATMSNAQCSQQNPCDSLEDIVHNRVTSARSWVRVNGGFPLPVDVRNSATIVGGTLGTITAQFGTTLYLMSTDAGSVNCNGASINMHDVMLRGEMNATGCQIAAVDSWFFGNILANGSETNPSFVRLSRAHIFSIGTTIHLINSEFEFDNVLANDPIGIGASGLTLFTIDNTLPLPRQQIMLSTIVHSYVSSSTAKGILCNTTNPVKISSTIITNDSGVPDVSGNCYVAYSIISAGINDATSGPGNIFEPITVYQDGTLEDGSVAIDNGSPLKHPNSTNSRGQDLLEEITISAPSKNKTTQFADR